MAGAEAAESSDQQLRISHPPGEAMRIEIKCPPSVRGTRS
jgi:hypothetical protein